MENRMRDLGTREGYLGAIRDCGRYIIDHAEGILGEYPGGLLTHMDIDCDISFDAPPTITVTKQHFAPPVADGR